MHKKIFSGQPYWVGSRDGKSLAVIIPAKIVKEEKIDASTIFRIQSKENILILERMPPIEENLKSVDIVRPSQQINSKS